MMYPESGQIAGRAIAAIPQVGLDTHQWFFSKPRPTMSNSWLRPEALLPVSLLSNQFHTTPEANIDTAIGNR